MVQDQGVPVKHIEATVSELYENWKVEGKHYSNQDSNARQLSN